MHSGLACRILRRFVDAADRDVNRSPEIDAISREARTLLDASASLASMREIGRRAIQFAISYLRAAGACHLDELETCRLDTVEEVRRARDTLRLMAVLTRRCAAVVPSSFGKSAHLAAEAAEHAESVMGLMIATIEREGTNGLSKGH